MKVTITEKQGDVETEKVIEVENFGLDINDPEVKERIARGRKIAEKLWKEEEKIINNAKKDRDDYEKLPKSVGY